MHCRNILIYCDDAGAVIARLALNLLAKEGSLEPYTQVRHRAVVLFLVLAGTSGHAWATRCEDLPQLHLPHAQVTAAQPIAAGSFSPPASGATFASLPAFCRVLVTSKPTPDSLINIEVWLPFDKAWNKKYLQNGCGGYCGSMQLAYPALARAIRRGYASAATDDGNQSFGGATFAMGHPEKLTDFGYRALKETTDIAKAVIRAFSGLRPRRSYFSGCSDGGREALMEAQRFPGDFDGILAGAPANNWVRLFAGMVAGETALLKNPDSYIPQSKLGILSKAVRNQCGSHDTGAPGDAFLSEPLSCDFDPSTTQCAADQDNASCLTAAQVAAAKAIYRGPIDARTGRRIAPGLSPGNEDDPTTWPIWVTGASREATLSYNNASPAFPLPFGQTSLRWYFGSSFFAHFVYQDPALDIFSLDLGEAIGAADRRIGQVIDATNPDLRAFRHHGGKLIQYHGLADAAVPPGNSIEYYDTVRASMFARTAPRSGVDGYGDLQGFYRLFMAPGMAHCGGGPGLNDFGAGNDPPVVDASHDILTALERWVEHGVAPTRIIASHYVEGNPLRGVHFQRPLCPFPQSAHYDGKSNPNDASSFACQL